MGGVFFVLHRKLGGISHEFSPTRGEIRNGGLSVEIQNGTPLVVTFTLIIRASVYRVAVSVFEFCVFSALNLFRFDLSSDSLLKIEFYAKILATKSS